MYIQDADTHCCVGWNPGFWLHCLLHFSHKQCHFHTFPFLCENNSKKSLLQLLKNPHFHFKYFLQACLCGNDRNHLSVISQLVWPLLIALVTAVLLQFFLFPLHLSYPPAVSHFELKFKLPGQKKSRFVMLVECLAQCVLKYMFSFNMN